MRARRKTELMYPVKTPALLKPLAKDLLWHIEDVEKKIYLTFDDGPTPGVTEEILKRLSRYQALATFFCLGKNIQAHTALYSHILTQGHQVGNHTYDHPDGWKTSNYSYFKNVLRANEFCNSPLFRPPYGRITPGQAAALKRRYTIVMWDVLSADFDSDISAEQCLKNVIDHAHSGSIVVFHDSIKAHKKMLYALEGVLDHFSGLDYEFHSLPS